MCELAGIEEEAELWQRWLRSPWVRLFESGRCTPEEFAHGMVDEWSLNVGTQEFLSSFATWPRAPYPGARSLVHDTAERVRTGCLSNTNVMHWEGRFLRWGITEEFDVRFASHEIGKLKPDPELFEWVLAALGVEGARVLFLDDNAINVEGARASGLRSVCVRGVAEARSALVADGVLSNPTPTRRSAEDR